jgi:hypothetical protein
LKNCIGIFSRKDIQFCCIAAFSTSSCNSIVGRCLVRGALVSIWRTTGNARAAQTQQQDFVSSIAQTRNLSHVIISRVVTVLLGSEHRGA